MSTMEIDGLMMPKERFDALAEAVEIIARELGKGSMGELKRLEELADALAIDAHARDFVARLPHV